LPKLKAAGHRVLIYSQMVKLLEILAEYIEGEGYIFRQLIGSTASEVRL
jgi:SNF2 family DNA or RNA helicase